MPPHQFEHVRSAPKKHSGVPEEMSTLQKRPGRLSIRLFAKTFDLDRLRLSGFDVLRKFDVTVASFRPARLNAQHHHAVLFRRPKSRLHEHPETALFEDQVIR